MTRCPYKGQPVAVELATKGAQDQKREKQRETNGPAGSETGETGRTGEMDAAGAWWQIVCRWGLQRENLRNTL